MDHYFTAITLLGLRDQNLPPFKYKLTSLFNREARLKRYKSIKKMIELLDTASKLAPQVPLEAFMLNPSDPEWDDDMNYPTMEHTKYVWQGCAFGFNLFLYSYNYNTMTANIRLRLMRYLFPVISFAIFGNIYWGYKEQLTKVQLFDEYVQLRAKELVKQNEYLFEHEDFKRFIWFFEDFKETLGRVHRQANNHESSDFQDSELTLQDFIKRYSNASTSMPLDENRRASLF